MVKPEKAVEIAHQHIEKYERMIARAALPGGGHVSVSECRHLISIWEGVLEAKGVWAALAPHMRQEVLEALDDAGELPPEIEEAKQAVVGGANGGVLVAAAVLKVGEALLQAQALRARRDPGWGSPEADALGGIIAGLRAWGQECVFPQIPHGKGSKSE